MHDINTRHARQEDLTTLLLFEQGVISAERPFDSTLDNDPINYYDLAAMIGSETVQLIVAETGDRLVGCGYCRIENAKPYLSHAQHGYLGFMYVVPELRGSGINKIIIDELSAWARSRGIGELRLDVYYENAAAVHAYEKAGFCKHMIEMRKSL